MLDKLTNHVQMLAALSEADLDGRVMARAMGDFGESAARFWMPALRAVLEGKPVKRISFADILLRGRVAYKPALGLKGLAASASTAI